MSPEARFVKAILLAAGIAVGLPLFEWMAGPFLGRGLAGALWLSALAFLYVAIVAARTVSTPARVRLRSLGIDLALTGLGLLAAAGLASPGPFGRALAVWGFALVQCLRLLAPRPRGRPAASAGEDRFEEACARARDLLASD